MMQTQEICHVGRCPRGCAEACKRAAEITDVAQAARHHRLNADMTSVEIAFKAGAEWQAARRELLARQPESNTARVWPGKAEMAAQHLASITSDHGIKTSVLNAIKLVLSQREELLARQVPAFTGVADRKLSDLLSQGYAITGYSFEMAGDVPKRGFITAGGLVGWWRPYEARQMPEWMPIETAPKDGTEIWVFNGQEYNRGQGLMKWLDHPEYQGWIWADEFEADSDPIPAQPTHWMLPIAAPTAAGAEEDKHAPLP